MRTLGLAAHLVEIGADTVIGLEVLARDTVIATDNAFGAAEVHDDMAIFDALDDTGDDFADTVLVLIVLALAFGIANLLHDDLFGRLGSNTAEIERRKLFLQLVTCHQVLINLLGLGQAQFLGLVLELLVRHNGLDAPQRLLACHRIDLRTNVVLLAVFRFCGLLDCFLHGLDDNRLINCLLFGDRFRDLQDFQPVG